MYHGIHLRQNAEKCSLSLLWLPPPMAEPVFSTWSSAVAGSLVTLLSSNTFSSQQLELSTSKGALLTQALRVCHVSESDNILQGLQERLGTTSITHFPTAAPCRPSKHARNGPLTCIHTPHTQTSCPLHLALPCVNTATCQSQQQFSAPPTLVLSLSLSVSSPTPHPRPPLSAQRQVSCSSAVYRAGAGR